MNQTDLSSLFSSLGLQPLLLKNLDSLGYQRMTAIQAQSLPTILQGKDLIGQAKTGSGKTAAFGIGLLEKLDPKAFKVQSLVICPTRELAAQVAKEIRQLARSIPNVKVLTVTGGTHFASQTTSIEHGVHIIVGTPGRIEDHIGRGTLNLQSVNTLVLDEADRMLDMGFQDALDRIVQQMPAKRQTMLFSATYPDKIEAIAKRVMRQPVMVKVAEQHNRSSIEQHFYQVSDDHQRRQALRGILLSYRPKSALVFCNTKIDTQEVAEELQAFGFSVLALHGDLEQKDRAQILLRFANKSAAILVATDVAARGLDIDALDAVINFHIANDPEVHTHRIGRTGRAGSQGWAFSFYSEAEFHKLAFLDSDIDPIHDCEPLPDFNQLDDSPIKAAMGTLQIDAGKKHKIRPGDILGALTANKGVAGNQVGQIDIFDRVAYVAIERAVLSVALNQLRDGKLKGRRFRVWVLKD